MKLLNAPIIALMMLISFIANFGFGNQLNTNATTLTQLAEVPSFSN